MRLPATTVMQVSSQWCLEVILVLTVVHVRSAGMAKNPRQTSWLIVELARAESSSTLPGAVMHRSAVIVLPERTLKQKLTTMTRTASHVELERT